MGKTHICGICTKPVEYGKHNCVNTEGIKYLRSEVERLTAERDELKATLQLMADASRHAALLWKAQHPGDVWPDQAENMVWLVEEHKRIAAELAAARKALADIWDEVFEDDDHDMYVRLRWLKPETRAALQAAKD